MSILECLECLQNVVCKITSFGLLPDNTPEIELRGYMYDKVDGRLVLTFSTRNHSAIFSKIMSKDCGFLIEPLKIDQKVSKGEDIDVILPVSTSFERLQKVDIELYFQDMQNRRYVTDIWIYPQNNDYSQLKIRRSFTK